MRSSHDTIARLGTLKEMQFNLHRHRPFNIATGFLIDRLTSDLQIWSLTRLENGANWVDLDFVTGTRIIDGQGWLVSHTELIAHHVQNHKPQLREDFTKYC